MFSMETPMCILQCCTCGIFLGLFSQHAEIGLFVATHVLVIMVLQSYAYIAYGVPYNIIILYLM